MAGVTVRPDRRTTARMSCAGPTPSREPRPVSFSGWREELATAEISPEQRWRFATEISRFLRYCEVLTAPVTVPRSREYLSRVPLVSARPGAREALRWFFKAARAAERDGGRPACPPRDSGVSQLCAVAHN